MPQPQSSSRLNAVVRWLAIAMLVLLVPRFGNTATAPNELSFSNIPLFLGQTTKSNVIMAIDNSGSTDFETSVLSNNGEFFWNISSATCSSGSQRNSFSGCGQNAAGTADASATSSTLNVNPAGSSSFDEYVYLFPNGTSGVGSRVYSDSTFGAIPPLPAFAFTRSSTWNKSYFDPSKTYAPWEKYDQTNYSNASITAAPADPSQTGSITMDMTSDVVSYQQTATSTACSAITTTTSASWGFTVHTGMTLPAGTCMSVNQQTFNCVGKTGVCPTTTYTAKGDTCSTTATATKSGTTTCVGQRWTSLAAATPVGNNAISGDTNSVITDATVQYIRYYPATFWLPSTAASPYTSFIAANRITTGGLAPDGTAMYGYQIKSANFSNATEYNNAIQNFANWFSYYRKRILALKSGIAASFNSLGTPLRLQNFAIGTTSSNLVNANTASQSMYDSSVAADLSKFYSQFMSLKSNGGTPNREAVRYMGAQFHRTDTAAPINSICQKNFGILFTDGYSNALSGSVSAYSGVNSGNVDAATTTPYTTFGANANPYKDAVAYSMADETMYDYVGPLRSDSAPLNYSGQHAVPVSPLCANASHDPTLDCNDQLHMVFYGVILNSLGLSYNGSANAVANAYTTTPTWPSSSALANQSPAQVDDLFHAAVNGRGKMLNASSPDDISNQLQLVISEITAQTGSGSSIALNSTSISSGSAVYAARFYNADWSGQLQRFSIVTSGPTIGQLNSTPDWDAQPLLDASFPLPTTPTTTVVSGQNTSGRKILTYNPSTYAGVAFQWANLSSNQQAMLNTNPVTVTPDTNGTLRLNFLRGDRTYEVQGSSPRFRTRGHELGDIVSSSPFYVGAPIGAYGAYSDSSYTTFRTTNASRRPMVYVGSNDGMLHGFNADTAANGGGTELLAYVPSKAYGDINGSSVVPLLANLTSTNYVHSFIVDGSPSVVDAKVKGNWKSVLVSGMGQGGQGIFALDVTNPGNFSEANAASIVMWEFTDADDPDLGYTYSQPSIVKMANGKWAAIVGNGYNNTSTAGGADVNYSGNTSNSRTSAAAVGKAALFIIMLDGPSGTAATGSRWIQGTDYFKIYAGAGTTTVANGLATPAAVDVDGDGMVDYIYGGDLLGNLWRFNVTASSPGSWSVGYNGNPIFVAKDTTGTTEPITERPEVGFNLNAPNPTTKAQPQLTVYFGTGRFLDQNDTSTSGQKTQTFYAIFDRFDDLVTTSRTAPVTPATRDVNNSAPTTYNMIRQQIIGEVTAAGTPCADATNCYRISTANPVGNSNQGWYIDLINAGAASPANNGERQVTNPVLSQGRIIFTTLIPGANPCSGGGGGYLMELSAINGSRLASAPIDVNQNGKVDTDGTDNVTFTYNGVTSSYVVSGAGSSVGIPSTAALERLTDSSFRKYIGGSKGMVGVVVESASERSGRVTWRELTP